MTTTLPTTKQHYFTEEQYSKTENKRWLYSEYDEEDTALVLNSFEVEVPLSDVYEQVNFEEVEEDNNQNEV